MSYSWLCSSSRILYLAATKWTRTAKHRNGFVEETTTGFSEFGKSWLPSVSCKGTYFHRVIPGFMDQFVASHAKDPQSPRAPGQECDGGNVESDNIFRDSTAPRSQQAKLGWFAVLPECCEQQQLGMVQLWRIEASQQMYLGWLEDKSCLQ